MSVLPYIAAALGGLVVLGSTSKIAPEPGPQPEPEPEPEPEPGVWPTPEPGELPMVDGHLLLPNEPTLVRDQLIFEAVRQGYALPLTYEPIDCSRNGVEAILWVSKDAVMVPVAGQTPEGKAWRGPCRINTRHPTACLIAQMLGGYTHTTRISDLAYAQADVHLGPMLLLNPNDPTKAHPRMAYTEQMIHHSQRISDALGEQTAVTLSRPMGKDWAADSLYDRHPDRAINYGCQNPDAGYRGPTGVPVYQPLSYWHKLGHVDYIQTITVMRKLMIVDGARRDVADIARHPTLHTLVSDTGPIQSLLHPAVRLAA